MRVALFFLLCTAFTIEAKGQGRSDGSAADSLSLRDLAFPRPGQQLIQPVILLPIDFADSTVVTDLPPGFLHLSMLSRPESQQTLGLLSPLRYQTNRQNPWRFFTNVLEVVYAGGTAYLTYEALKKYGYIR